MKNVCRNCGKYGEDEDCLRCGLAFGDEEPTVETVIETMQEVQSGPFPRPSVREGRITREYPVYRGRIVIEVGS